MRTVVNLNRKWAFAKHATAVPEAMPKDWIFVNLPHSWNAIDGQDGENDYFRGTAYYAKTIQKAELPTADRYYLELRGANSSADVYLNGEKLAHHDGGYSTWRVDLTEDLKAVNLLVVAVDNAANETVYPQMADFTFYGGLYRDVNLICVTQSHFDLDYYGAPGIQVTPTVTGKDAEVEVKTYVTNLQEGQTIRYTVYDRDEQVIATAKLPIPPSSFPFPMSICGTAGRIPIFTAARQSFWKTGRCWTMSAPASAAVPLRSTRITVLSSTARSILCEAYPATRTAGASATRCFRSITKRISS